MTRGLTAVVLLAGLATKPIDESAVGAWTETPWGPTTAGAVLAAAASAARAGPEPSAAVAVPANDATRPPEAATMAAPLTAG